ncbi:MAG: electron transport complex subunit RsxE, partial [OM182 bacterium]
MNRFSQIACDGIWRQNPVLVQLLGLCPLLAVSTSFVTAFSLGVITLFVLTASNIVISIIRLLLHDAMRMPTQIIVI